MENIFRKSYIERIQKAFSTEKIVLLTGPRQVGKTTLMKQYAAHTEQPSLYINMEDFFGISGQRSTKKAFIQRLQFEYNFDVYQAQLLLLDEIQVIDNAEILLKSLYDDDQIKCTILVTGSRFLGQSRLGSTLVGRGETIRIWSFSFPEFLQAKGKEIAQRQQLDYAYLEPYLQEYQMFGGYPAVVMAQSKEEKIIAYKRIIDRFLEKDFTTYIGGRDELISFQQLLQYISRTVGSIRKTATYSRQKEGLSNYKVEKYLQFLLDSYLLVAVPPYFSDKTKEYNSRVKYYFHDIGLLQFFGGQRSVDEHSGKLHENAVLLQAYQSPHTDRVLFWHTNNGSEIDFIVQDIDQSLTAIEVKSNNFQKVPKIFSSFVSAYHQTIKNLTITTQSISENRSFQGISLKFTPRWKI